MASFVPRKGPGGKRAWQAHVRRRGYPAQVRTCDSKAEAWAWAAGIESEMACGAFVSRAEADNTTLARPSARYGREVSAGKRGAVQEFSVISALSSGPLGPRALGSLQGKDLAEYRDTLLAEDYSPITIKRRLAILSHLYPKKREKPRRLGRGWIA